MGDLGFINSLILKNENDEKVFIFKTRYALLARSQKTNSKRQPIAI